MFAIQSTTSLRRACSPFDPVSDSRLSPPAKRNLRERLGDAAGDNRGTGFISVTVCRVSGLPPILWSLGSWSDIQSWCSKAPAILRNVHWKDGPPIFPSAGSQHASTSCQPRMVVPWAQGNAAGSSPSLQLSQILYGAQLCPSLACIIRGATLRVSRMQCRTGVCFLPPSLDLLLRQSLRSQKVTSLASHPSILRSLSMALHVHDATLEEAAALQRSHVTSQSTLFEPVNWT